MDAVADARQFLIDCLVARRRPELLATLAEQIAAQAPDWDAVGALALSERVAPLLYYSTRRHHLLPDELLHRCHKAYTETGLLNALRLNELAGLLAALATGGIDVILLKGVALAERVYSNIALRPMVDIDLLVRKANVCQALALLQDAGYRFEGPEISPDAALEFENEILLRERDRSGWVIELHWSLFDSPYYQERLPEGTLWETAESVAFEGSTACALSPEHELLHLCGHLALHHRGVGLLWWNDIADLITCDADRLDWDRLLTEAEALNLIMPLQAVLPEAAERWAAPVPPDVLYRLAALVPRPDEARVYHQLTAGHRPPARRLLSDLSEIPGWGARLRFLFRNLFPSAAYMDERYGISRPWLRPFYYLRRWLVGLGGLLSAGSNRPS